MKNKITVIFFALLGLLLLICFWIFLFIKKYQKEIKEIAAADSTYNRINIPSDYKSLLKEDPQLNIIHTIYNKTRNPISELNYNNKFEVIIYKFYGKCLLPLKYVIKQENNSVDKSQYVYYGMINAFNLLSEGYLTGQQSEVSKIYLTISGSSTLVAESDSLIYYSAKASAMSIQYDQAGVKDFFLGSFDDTPPVPIPFEIIFFNRSGSLYFIQLLPVNGNDRLPVGTLRNLLNQI